MAKKEVTYAEAMAEIEKILARLRNEEMDVDSLAAEVKRATELVAQVDGQNPRVELMLVKRRGQRQTRIPFEAAEHPFGRLKRRERRGKKHRAARPLRFFQNILRRAVRAAGAKEGDSVVIGDMEFDFVE